MILLLIPVFILSLLFLLQWKFRLTKNARLFAKVPGPPELPIIGHGLQFLTGRDGIWKFGREMNGKYPIFKIWFFDRRIVNINTPEDVELVLSNSKHNRKSFIYSYIQPWLQEGLLISHGQKWHTRRKILTPAFHFNILKTFTSVIEENSRKLVERIREETKMEKSNLTPIITSYTLHSICETAMGTKLDTESATAQDYKRAVHELGDCIIHRMSRIWLRPAQLFALSEVGKRHDKLLGVLKNFTQQVINERRDYRSRVGFSDVESEEYKHSGEGKRRMAMLDLLLSAEKDGLIDAAGVQEEVDTFMFEGHDTTMTALVFTLMLLANHPDVQEKIYKECKEVLGDDLDREASMADLMELKYLECCIKEGLRLYPSVPFISRILGEDIVLSGYQIPAETTCHIHIYDLQRSAKLWTEPNEFRPDRFNKENSMKRHHFLNVPFSAGPRNCIGQKFAMIEMKSALAAIIRQFVMEPVTRPEKINFMADLILRPTEPIYVRFRARNSK